MKIAKPSGKFTRTSFEVGDRVEITAPGRKYDGAIARILNITSKETTVGLLVDGRSYSLKVSPNFLQKTNKFSPNESGEIPHQIEPDGQATVFTENDLPEYKEAYSLLEELVSMRAEEPSNKDLRTRTFELISPDGEYFTGENLSQFAQQHGLSEGQLYALFRNEIATHKGWRKPGGKELPIPETHYFISPEGEVFKTTNLTQFAREHDLCPIALSRLTRGLKLSRHKGWQYCDRDGNPIIRPDIKHQNFKFLSPDNKLIEGKNLAAFARENGLNRVCLQNVLSGKSLEHKGYRLPWFKAGDRVLIVWDIEHEPPAHDFGRRLAKESVLIDEYPYVSASGIPDYNFIAVKFPGGRQLVDVKHLQPIEEELCSRQPISSAVAEGIPRELLARDTDPSGELNRTNTPPPSGEADSPQPPSTNPISETCQIALFNPLEYQKSLSEVVLARIFQLQEVEPDLREVAEICFLSTSDSFDSSSLQFLSGKMLMQSFRPKTGKISPKSSRVLQRWGMWGPGKCEMGIGMSPKTENGFSWWVFSGDVRTTQSSPDRKTLAEILGGSPVNSVTGDRMDESFTLRANSYKQGRGNENHPNTFVKVFQSRVEPIDQDCPTITGNGFQHRPSNNRSKSGASLAVVYHAADGDRDYSQEAPTLRGLSGDGGAGAYQVRDSERLRPIKPEEAEGLMGWEIGSTASGIDGEGNKIAISNTNRIAACGNGIIPAEITEMLIAIKPFLENKLEQEIPQNLRLAYKQLRKNKTHLEAKEILRL